MDKLLRNVAFCKPNLKMKFDFTLLMKLLTNMNIERASYFFFNGFHKFDMSGLTYLKSHSIWIKINYYHNANCTFNHYSWSYFGSSLQGYNIKTKMVMLLYSCLDSFVHKRTNVSTVNPEHRMDILSFHTLRREVLIQLIYCLGLLRYSYDCIGWQIHKSKQFIPLKPVILFTVLWLKSVIRN